MSNVRPAIEPHLVGAQCPHMAVLLHSADELPAVLASFYALGAARRGWLVHRAVRGQAEADRVALRARGLDVDGLEARGELAVAEFDPDEPPEHSTTEWERGLESALARGRSGLWYSRFAVGGDDAGYRSVLPFERAWEERFHDLPVVTLCPYIVGSLSVEERADRIDTLAAVHDGVLAIEGEGARWEVTPAPAPPGR